MSNINNEIISLLKEIFYELPNKVNEFLPIIKSSKNISKIIPFLLIYDTNKEEDINQAINLLFILKEFFILNNGLIPLFMKDTVTSRNTTFYECLINLFLNESINDDNKLIIEELIIYINKYYSLSKNSFEYIYQKLSKYYTNNSEQILTDKLLLRYLNLLNLLYTDISYNQKKSEEIKNYIYFNGINSDLSFLLNNKSFNLNTDYPTIEKGCSFVFWIKLDRKLIEEYFKILPEKTNVNFIKINIGGQIILFKLIDPDNIMICSKDILTNQIDITYVFHYNEWNNFVFIIEPTKGKKISTRTYINNNLINGTLILKNDLNSKEKINNIDLFENILGKVSSVLFFSFIIDYKLIDHFSSIKGFHKNKILSQLLNSFDKEYTYKNSTNSKKEYYNESLNKKIKIQIKDQNIYNLICCFCPLSYEKNKNIIDDVFGNYIGKLNNNDGVNNYVNKNKNIRDLGGLNNLLPIIELMLSSLKEENPYKLIDKNILTERTLQEFLIIIQKILIGHEKNIINEKETHFLSCLSLFLEKIPSKFYTLNVLQSIIGLIDLPIEVNDNQSNSQNTNNFINLILLNERIITKFTPRAQIELWDGVYEVFTRDLIKIKETLSPAKICLLLRFYDEQRYEKYCCYKHACLFNNGDIDKDRKNIMYPEMNAKVGKLFQIIQLYIDKVIEDNQIGNIFKLLALDLSPCLQKKILNLYISHFSNNKISQENKEKTLDNLLKNKYIELSEYALKVSLLDIRIDIFKLFNLLIGTYLSKFREYLKINSIEISQMLYYYEYNILPDKLIIEYNNSKDLDSSERNNSLSINEIKNNTTINEELLNIDKKYIHLIDYFNKEEYKKDIKLFWSLLCFSFKDEIYKDNKKLFIINPFIFKLSMDFVSRVNIFYVEEFLILLLSSLKDQSISNSNIFYKDKLFFPWLIDTIFYFYNNENCNLMNDKDIVKSIQSISLDILCELFSHHRENEEIFKRLKYILDYSYFHKKMNKDNKLKEIIRITRFLLEKIFECYNEYIDIKSKIAFEFMFLFKNSEKIFNDDGFHFKEISNFSERDFFEIDSRNTTNSFSAWETVDNNDVNDNNLNINMKENEEDNLNIGNMKNNNTKYNRSIIILPKKINQIVIGDETLIPDYIYEGINYIEKDILNENDNNININIYGNNKENLENSWSDYKLFSCINDYFKKNLWGFEVLCKKVNIGPKKSHFADISNQLFSYYVEIKDNRNDLINEILKYIKTQGQTKSKLNVFYINLILLSIAIDISENDNEKENLYNDYKQFLFFFILASINLYQISDTKKSITNIYSLQKIFNNLIGYGFLYLKKRDKNKFDEFKNILITPIFKNEEKNFAGQKKKILKNSIIGKLFALKDTSKDDASLIEAENKKQLSRSVRAETTFIKNGLFKKSIRKSNINQNNEDINNNIIFKGDPNEIINEVIEESISYYRKMRTVTPLSNIIIFYVMKEEKEKGNEKYNYIDKANEQLNQKIINEEKRIFKTLKEVIPFLDNEIKMYWNNSCLDQLKRRREYKKVKKRLFSWGGFWSDRKLFFEHPEYLKLQVKNHFTKEMTKVLLTPILDIDYYLPNFSKFDKNKLFNKDDYKYKIYLNVEEILKIKEEKKNENKIEEEDKKEEIILNINKEKDKEKDIIIEKVKDEPKNINSNEINGKKNEIENDDKNKINDNKNEINDNKNEINDNKNEINDNKNEINDNKNEINDNKNKINDKKNKINDNKNQKNDNKNKINDNRNKINDNKNKINDNKNKINDNKNKINDNKNKINDNKNKKNDNKNKTNDNKKSNLNINNKINNFNDKVKFLNQRLSLKGKNIISKAEKQNKNNTINTNNNIKDEINIDKKDMNANNINENNINENNVNENNNKINENNANENKNKKNENIIKEEKKVINKDMRNCLTKDFNYLQSLYKFTFKGIWDQYQKFYKGKMTLDNIILGNKDTFEILIQSKLMSSSEKNKVNENLYICCIVKPTHHIKGYMSTEKTSIKFTHCEEDEDEESQKILENDPSYDRELKCCFGSTFKEHLKDREKVCIEIKYSDMKYILFRNYFYQQTACEIYTFSNKSYFLNFKDNKEFKKFIDNILNHDLFRPIKGKDFKGKKILGYEKTNDNKQKPFKVKKIMENWQNNNISTLHYIMWLNIFSGRSFNDLTQYPVVPWIITNYDKDELSKEDYRDLSIPIGMMEVNEKSGIRKETFIEYYESLKEDLKDANPDFNYNEYLKKGEDYLEDYKSKKNKKKKDNNNELGIEDINISNIELNQIPYYFGTHYSCPTFVSHYLMRIFPFSLLSIEIQGNKFDDPDRLFISLIRAFETTSTSKDDVRELIPEFYTLPEMFLNKNNLNLTQDKLDSEGKAVIVHDVELPQWCNNISYNFISEMRKHLENNELKINKWIDLIFGSLQRGEKAEENHNIFKAQTYEGMVKIDSVTDYDSRNALLRLCEIGVTPKQIFKVDTKKKSDNIAKGYYLYEGQNLYKYALSLFKYKDIIKEYYKNKGHEEKIFPKIIKIKWIGVHELLLVYNFNYVTRFKFKKTSEKEEKFNLEEKSIIQANNISSKYASSYLISQQNPPIIIYNKNKYMIKGGFWDGRLEINSIIIDPKEKEKHFSNKIYIKEGPIVVMEMTKDEKILLCGTKIGYIICFSVEGPNLEIKNKMFLHKDEITSININDNLNMFATSSLDGYINMHILPSFDLVRSIKVSIANHYYANDDDDNLFYANNVFLSSCPLPCVVTFISSKRLFRIFTINGEYVGDIEETNNSNYIKSFVIFNDLNFQEYIIYGTDDGKIKIRKFPNMDLINNAQPSDCEDIISLDISPDKKYCYIWLKKNEMIVIKDYRLDIDEENKKKLEKKEKEKDN